MASHFISIFAAALLLISPGVLCKTITPEREAKAGLFSREVDQMCFLRIGCLSTTQDWYSTLHRPMNFEPETPAEIGVAFTLYTRENLRGEVIAVDEKEMVPSTFYKGDRKTKFIIHGFLGNAKADWVLDIMKALLTRMNINVVTVDWSKGAGIPYNQAAVNTRVVGLEIAYLVNTLIKTRGASAEDFHIIGHSLGAHTAGYAGERIPGLGRITGLDPAGPWFTKMPNYVRLDPTDAKFVDVIHTDAELIGFGMVDPIGHVDFFPNGGYRQPGCSVPLKMDISEMMDAVSEAPSCSHSRSELLFLESITSSPYFEAEMEESYGEEHFEELEEEQGCPFTAFQCDSYESFQNGSCTSCGENRTQCALMGLDADKYPGKNDPMTGPRKFFLMTNSDSPFCGYHYAVNAMLPAEYKAKIPAVGDLIISASGEEGVAMDMDLTDTGVRRMFNGSAYNFLGFSSTDTGKIAKVDVTWKWNPSLLSMDVCMICVRDLYLSKLEITNLGYYPGEKFKKSSTCKNEPPLLLKNKVAKSVNLKC